MNSIQKANELSDAILKLLIEFEEEFPELSIQQINLIKYDVIGIKNGQLSRVELDIELNSGISIDRMET